MTKFSSAHFILIWSQVVVLGPEDKNLCFHTLETCMLSNYLIIADRNIMVPFPMAPCYEMCSWNYFLITSLSPGCRLVWKVASQVDEVHTSTAGQELREALQTQSMPLHAETPSRWRADQCADASWYCWTLGIRKVQSLLLYCSFLSSCVLFLTAQDSLLMYRIFDFEVWVTPFLHLLKLWGETRTWIPHSILPLLLKPHLPGPSVLLQGQPLHKAKLYAAHRRQSAPPSGIMACPRRHGDGLPAESSVTG